MINISCYGENSHFIRFNNSKVRQIGDVSDIRLSIDSRLQELIRYELIKTISKYSAHSG